MWIVFIFVTGIVSLLFGDYYYRNKLQNLLSNRAMKKLVENTEIEEANEEQKLLLREAEKEVEDFMKNI